MSSRLPRIFVLVLTCVGCLTIALGLSRVAYANEPAGSTASPGTAKAQQPESPTPSPFFPAELAQRIVRLASDVENAAKGIQRVKDRESGLAGQRLELERIEVEAQELIAALKPRLSAVTAQLQKLGPPPEKDAAPEAPNVASERERLTSIQSNVEGAIKSAELALVRSRQLMRLVQHHRQALFARELMQRTGSPLWLSTWQDLAAELPRTSRQISNLAKAWWHQARDKPLSLVLVVAMAAGVYGVLRLALSVIGSRMRVRGEGWAAYFPNTGDAIWRAATGALPPVAAAITLYGGLAGSGLLTATVGELALAGLKAFAVFIGVRAVAEVALAPTPSGFRLLDLAGAPKLLRLARVLAALIAIETLLRDVVRILYLPLEIGVVQTTLTNLAFAAVLAAFVRIPLGSREAAVLQPPSRSRPLWIKVPVAAAALMILGTTLAGYVALGQFISTQAMLAGLTLFLLLLAHAIIRRAVGALADGERPMGRILETRLGLDSERTSYVTRLIIGVVDTVLLLVAVPLILLTWGYTRDDFIDWLKVGIVGFEIGRFQISLVRILLALGLFLILLFLTRAFQRWLDRSVLMPARIDRSIAHSVLMGVGYTGVGLAIIFALSYAGLDFTQLAIVAGALSLGIGFGLQAIFNNFVSGIILLIERPVKVGDWIVVNGQEGFVRRINVRATEIETFDRSSLIIPNSELITGTVMNWTHRNAIGRLVVYVRVSYKADPEQVISILRRVAEDSPSILREPEPTVVFEDFGESAMIFSLRAFVPDVMRRLAVQTELRLAIAKSFREAGIEIPYLQHDIHLRDLDGVKHAFARAMEARRREQELEAGGT